MTRRPSPYDPASQTGTAQRVRRKLRAKRARCLALRAVAVREMHGESAHHRSRQRLALAARSCGCTTLLRRLARIVPDRCASDFGAWLFRTFGPLTSAAPRRRDQSAHRLPRRRRRRDRAACWTPSGTQLGRWFAEFPILDRIIADPEPGRGGRRRAAGGDPRRRGPGGVHLRPLLQLRDHAGGDHPRRRHLPDHLPGDQQPLCRRPHPREPLRATACTLFAPKGAEGARELLRALARGESVALMNDQKFNGGVAAPLFGVMAHTAPGPSSFALRFGIAAAADERPADAARPASGWWSTSRSCWRTPATAPPTSRPACGAINAFIEERVRERPAEWFWVHKRWPNELYKKALGRDWSPASASAPRRGRRRLPAAAALQ